jgi:hypothetical protein
MAASATHNGWRWDRDNSRLDFYYRGTRAGSVCANGMILSGTGGRISTSTVAGAAISIAADYTYGEGVELRYSSAKTASAFNGVYCHVDTSAANTSGIRAAEFCAKRSAAVAVGGLEGINGAAYARVDGTGTIGYMYGATGEVQMDDGYTGTITLLAGLRAKVATEDGATITKGYGVYIENEAVTGIKTLDAGIYLTATSTATGFGCLIDSTGTLTTVSDDKVLLFKFLRSDGTAVLCRYDTSGNALEFATS